MTLLAKQHQRTLAGFARTNAPLAYSILIADVAVYFACVSAAVLVDSLLLKSVFALSAGFFIAQLFVIGHDAGHAAYVDSRRANAVIARLCFMPSLHNYSLWLFVHNRLHHAFPNVKGYNSWSPMTPEEFQALPKWRQLLERVYRSPAGFGLYYLLERWIKDKLVPRRHTPTQYQRKAWLDFALNGFFVAGLVSAAITLAIQNGQDPVLAVLFGVVIPFIVWNHAMGLTIHQHHIHPRVRWYENLVAWREAVKSQSEVTLYIKYPNWYEAITHNIYVHPAHHINARIPLYNLQKAQTQLMRSFPESTQVIPFSLREFLRTLRSCKLYDYTQHQWLDFSGRPTTAAQPVRQVPEIAATPIPFKRTSSKNQ